MALPPLYIDGVGFWSPGLPGWPAAREALATPLSMPLSTSSSPLPNMPPGAAHEAPAAESAARRPSPALLPPAERRRVPDTVAVALEAASEAIAASGLDPALLPSVFASAYGDLGLLDQLCGALASPAPALSPTKFHNSVHNASAGYWAIGTQSRRPSTAVAAFDHSFAAGLLEAAALCVADDTPVLLVGCDGPAVGALAAVARSQGLLAAALVLSPRRSAASLATLAITLEPSPVAAPVLRTRAARALSANAMADALPVCEALAAGRDAQWAMPLSEASGLALRLAFLRGDGT